MQSAFQEKCRVKINNDSDRFVGIRYENGEVYVNFPIGFELSDGEKEIKKDISLLLTVLKLLSNKKDSEYTTREKQDDKVEFPMHAYLEIIYDFFSRGYYHKREAKNIVGKIGKINWSRTIKLQKPYYQGTDVYYLDYAIRKYETKESELITLIHEYCVYESFNKMGWLFTNMMPSKPRIKYNNRLFVKNIYRQMVSTYNDKNRILFENMLAVVNYLGDNKAKSNFYYGTYRFEYVWEKMIDRVFGIANKCDYFPKSSWNINQETVYNSFLKPDTIMLWHNNVYVLDAKYYKYGITEDTSDLPESASINKQITYGEYIAKENKFKKMHGSSMCVYNAFLMPYNCWDSDKERGTKIKFVGTATGDWKNGEYNYEKVYGILIDVKSLMQIRETQESGAISKLAELIDNVSR